MFQGSPRLSLKQPLGGWLASPHESWEWFFSPRDRLLIHRTKDGFEVHQSSSASAQATFLKEATPHMDFDVQDLELAAVKESSGSYLLKISSSLATSIDPEPPPAHSSLESMQTSLPEEDQWATATLEIPEDDCATLSEALREGTALAVSDGSFKDSFGTSAFVLEGKDGTHRLTGANVVPGHPDDQSAYRSEIAGVCAILQVLLMICQLFNITEGEVEIGLDGEAAMDRISGPYDPHCNARDFDLLTHVRALLKELPVTCTFSHIKGHQDDIEGQELDRRARLNIEMDSRAKAHWALHSPAGSPPNHKFSREPISVSITGRKLSRFHFESLYNEVYMPVTRAY